MVGWCSCSIDERGKRWRPIGEADYRHIHAYSIDKRGREREWLSVAAATALCVCVCVCAEWRSLRCCNWRNEAESFPSILSACTPPHSTGFNATLHHHHCATTKHIILCVCLVCWLSNLRGGIPTLKLAASAFRLPSTGAHTHTRDTFIYAEEFLSAPALASKPVCVCHKKLLSIIILIL